MINYKTYLNDYTNEVAGGLLNTVATDSMGSVIDTSDALERIADEAHKRSDLKSTFFFCGNGASCTMAEHISHDCFQNANLLTYTVSETSHITAISNDTSYENVFAYRISKQAADKDVLITISSSGNSPNIIKAIGVAREKGMFIVTLSGKGEDNKSRKMGNLNFFVPLQTYGLVESAHAILLHSWLDLYLDKYKEGRH